MSTGSSTNAGICIVGKPTPRPDEPSPPTRRALVLTRKNVASQCPGHGQRVSCRCCGRSDRPGRHQTFSRREEWDPRPWTHAPDPREVTDRPPPALHRIQQGPAATMLTSCSTAEGDPRTSGSFQPLPWTTAKPPPTSKRAPRHPDSQRGAPERIVTLAPNRLRHRRTGRVHRAAFRGRCSALGGPAAGS